MGHVPILAMAIVVTIARLVLVLVVPAIIVMAIAALAHHHVMLGALRSGYAGITIRLCHLHA